MVGKRAPHIKRSAINSNTQNKYSSEETQVAKKGITSGKKKAKPKSKSQLFKTQSLKQTAQIEKKHKSPVQLNPKSKVYKVQKEITKSKINIEEYDKSPVIRYSFIVRLTVENLCQLQRVEIEHVSGSRKKQFLVLDGERLVNFMKECIGPMDTPEILPSPEISDKRSNFTSSNILRSNLSLVIQDIRLFHQTEPENRTLTLLQNKPFVIQISFKLVGVDAAVLAIQETGYEIKIYSKEVTKGTSELLTKHSGILRKGLLEYIVPVDISGLTSGVYRLFTIVNLSLPTVITTFNSKTIIHIF
jgi:hypothetical protein